MPCGVNGILEKMTGNKTSIHIVAEPRRKELIDYYDREP